MVMVIMELQEQFLINRMNNFLFVIILFFLLSCEKKKNHEFDTSNQIITPKVFELKSSKDLKISGDTVYFKSKKFSGFLYELYPYSKDTLLLEGYLDGLLNGISRKWYGNKILMEERQYKNGKKNGKHIAYWENGKMKFIFTAKNDAYEGEMREWASNGKLYHLSNYMNGQEEGPQKMWYENGKIRANYFIRNGKRFGLLGTKNCKNVSDSIFVVR